MGKNKGQGVLETLLVLPLTMLVFSGFLYLIYWGVVYFYSSAKIEEALLCSASRTPIQICEMGLQRALSSLVLFKEPVLVRLNKTSFQAKASVNIDFFAGAFGKRSMFLEQNLKLPLEENIL